MQISAIICTHNRSAYLKKAIKSLAEQTLPKEQYEVVVVDNASNDDTEAVVESFRHLPNLRYIYEPILGLSQARNTGWHEARGEYIAFLDDDAIACPEWLERIVKAFETVKPRPGCVGGKIAAIWETERPPWLAKEMEPVLSINDFFKEEATFLRDDEPFLYGANIAYPREVIEKIGGFSTSLGRKGSNLLSGEDMLIRNNLRRHNFLDYYDPEICVYHHVLGSRLTKNWFYKRYFWHGVSQVIVDHITYHNGKRRHQFALAIFDMIYLLKHPARLVSMIMPANSKYWLLRRCSTYAAIGGIWARLRIGLGLESVA